VQGCRLGLGISTDAEVRANDRYRLIRRFQRLKSRASCLRISVHRVSVDGPRIERWYDQQVLVEVPKMISIGRLATLVLGTGAILIAGVTDCGGKTSGELATESISGAGGNQGAGGIANIGGAKGTTAVAPRSPEAHRPNALSCVGVYSPPEPPITVDPVNSNCARHADCTEGVNGRCVTSNVGRAGGVYYCEYDHCATDADCDPGKICYCTASISARCLNVGNCQTDADCGGGSYSYCSPSMSWDCGGYRPIDGYHCHTASDTCLDDSDCSGMDYCNFDVYSGTWKCTATNNTCVIG
jgi:hypothetical protein